MGVDLLAQIVFIDFVGADGNPPEGLDVDVSGVGTIAIVPYE